MSVGWKRQYETEAVELFCDTVMFFAAHDPGNEWLQGFARKTRLRTVMVSQRFISDMEHESIVRDRLDDCERCKKWHDDTRPCMHNERLECVYKAPEEQVRTIKRIFGEEATRFYEYSKEHLSLLKE